MRLSEEHATRARQDIDIDEPSIDALQACLLLVIAFIAAGRGTKAYMLLANAVGMTMALELHRELDPRSNATPVERETRRRLFWTCYLLDRFTSCGSKRPCLVADKIILLRLPCWSPNPASLPIEGEFFQCGSSDQYFQGGRRSPGSSGMLIEISRILGITNRYLAAGGVKGDSHFPWHTLSSLSKIRQDLDIWASGTEDVFRSLDTLFGQNDSTSLVLSKLIYHTIHCLIYRPFLPIDLAELAGNGQHQSWQIEATNMCFMHANAISELVELGRQTGTIEWPAFVGYCICTAGTVHIHGAHYNKHGPLGGEMSVFGSSAEFLAREMQQLGELQYAWASVQHQRQTLQGIYEAHGELVKSLGNMHYPPVLHLEDFFDRYSNIGGPGGPSFHFDAANITLADVVMDFGSADVYAGSDLYSPVVEKQGSAERASLKRKSTLQQGGRRRADSRALAPLASNVKGPIHTGLPTPSHPRSHGFSTVTIPSHQQYPSPAMLHSPASLTSPHQGGFPGDANMNGGMQDTDEIANKAAAVAAAGVAGFTIPSQHHTFSPAYSSYGAPNPGAARDPPNNTGTRNATNPSTNGPPPSYDPMFGGAPTNAFSSPTAWHDSSTPRPRRSVLPAAGSAATQQQHHHQPQQQQQQQLAHSPGGMSTSGGSTSTGLGPGPGEEKDPFLTLLEQLADSENGVKGPGSEFDFFFAGTSQ